MAVYPEYPTRRQSEGSFSLLFFFKLIGKMKRIVKQVVGIDVAQKELVVSLGGMHEDRSIEIYA